MTDDERESEIFDCLKVLDGGHAIPPIENIRFLARRLVYARAESAACTHALNELLRVIIGEEPTNAASADQWVTVKLAIGRISEMRTALAELTEGTWRPSGDGE